jgi:hypothetical protein
MKCYLSQCPPLHRQDTFVMHLAAAVVLSAAHAAINPVLSPLGPAEVVWNQTRDACPYQKWVDGAPRPLVCDTTELIDSIYFLFTHTRTHAQGCTSLSSHILSPSHSPHLHLLSPSASLVSLHTRALCEGARSLTACRSPGTTR